jgi:hypothetical protein
MTAAVTFAAAFAVFGAGHYAGDYLVQTHGQAMHKGGPGWAGRRACASHVATYTAVLAAFLALAAWRLALPVSPGRAAAGLTLNAVTHYFADRRTPLARLAKRAGKDGFWNSGEGLASGAAHIDQAWHWLWLFAAALITA